MAVFETFGKSIQSLKLKSRLKRIIFREKSKKTFYQINPAENFEIPKSLECDFPLRSNNEYKSEVEKYCLEWVMQFGLVTKKEAIERFKSAKFGIFGCYVYPNAPFDRLCLVINFMSWLFLLDDQIDNKNDLIDKPEKLKKILDGFLLVIDSDHCPDSAKCPAALALWDLWSKMKSITGRTWQLRF
ncbi:13573_t:CDS:1, partial [Racocetra persica]